MAKSVATYLEDDFVNGAETVEIVFGIVLAVGLGAALLAFQEAIIDGFDVAKGDIQTAFGILSNGRIKS